MPIELIRGQARSAPPSTACNTAEERFDCVRKLPGRANFTAYEPRATVRLVPLAMRSDNEFSSMRTSAVVVMYGAGRE